MASEWQAIVKIVMDHCEESGIEVPPATIAKWVSKLGGNPFAVTECVDEAVGRGIVEPKETIRYIFGCVKRAASEEAGAA